jgi:polysaccharide pyruvyl transferase WcaK-like protein
LYEGSFGWPWGVHLDPEALKKLRVPLFLLGVGTGSGFASALHKPSARAVREITLLNDYAVLSGARDVITLAWLKDLGVTNAKLMGDPATFIFNRPWRRKLSGHILVVIPPSRIWNSKRQFLNVYRRGRAVFRALAGITGTLLKQRQKVVVACNDPNDIDLAQQLFAGYEVTCPATPEEYFKILASSRAVLSGRLHTAVAAFSLGIPFLLIDIDGRTRGFVQTYQLDRWAVNTLDPDIAERLHDQTLNLLNESELMTWQSFIEKRNQLEKQAMDFLEEGLNSIRRGP